MLTYFKEVYDAKIPANLATPSNWKYRWSQNNLKWKAKLWTGFKKFGIMQCYISFIIIFLDKINSLTFQSYDFLIWELHVVSLYWTIRLNSEVVVHTSCTFRLIGPFQSKPLYDSMMILIQAKSLEGSFDGVLLVCLLFFLFQREHCLPSFSSSQFRGEMQGLELLVKSDKP